MNTKFDIERNIEYSYNDASYKPCDCCDKLVRIPPKLHEEYKKYFPSGEVQEIRYYDNGKLTEDCIIYNKDGSVRCIKKYIDGKLHCEVNEVDEDNNILFHGVYDRGVPIGDIEEWWPNGNRKMLSQWAKSTQGPFKRRRHGDFIKWYEDGSIQEYAHYHNGRLHGVHKKWNGDVVLFERLYVMGELEDEKYINEDSITEEYIEG